MIAILISILTSITYLPSFCFYIVSIGMRTTKRLHTVFVYLSCSKNCEWQGRFNTTRPHYFLRRFIRMTGQYLLPCSTIWKCISNLKYSCRSKLVTIKTYKCRIYITNVAPTTRSRPSSNLASHMYLCLIQIYLISFTKYLHFEYLVILYLLSIDFVVLSVILKGKFSR